MAAAVTIPDIFFFKQDLHALADEIGVEICIAHYPPYCSKFNPIEHRLFPHVTRACQGVVFTSIELVKELMEKTHTETGLKTFVHNMELPRCTTLSVEWESYLIRVSKRAAA
jgi:hypothetical protein